MATMRIFYVTTAITFEAWGKTKFLNMLPGSRSAPHKNDNVELFQLPIILLKFIYY